MIDSRRVGTSKSKIPI